MDLLVFHGPTTPQKIFDRQTAVNGFSSTFTAVPHCTAVDKVAQRPRLRVDRASRPVILPLLAAGRRQNPQAGRLRHTLSIALCPIVPIWNLRLTCYCRFV